MSRWPSDKLSWHYDSNGVFFQLQALLLFGTTSLPPIRRCVAFGVVAIYTYVVFFLYTLLIPSLTTLTGKCNTSKCHIPCVAFALYVVVWSSRLTPLLFYFSFLKKIIFEELRFWKCKVLMREYSVHYETLQWTFACEKTTRDYVLEKVNVELRPPKFNFSINYTKLFFSMNKQKRLQRKSTWTI